MPRLGGAGGAGGLFQDASIIQKLDRILVLAMLPHQREEPNAAFANPEIGGREGHV